MKAWKCDGCGKYCDDFPAGTGLWEGKDVERFEETLSVGVTILFNTGDQKGKNPDLCDACTLAIIKDAMQYEEGGGDQDE